MGFNCPSTSYHQNCQPLQAGAPWSWAPKEVPGAAGERHPGAGEREQAVAERARIRDGVHKFSRR